MILKRKSIFITNGALALLVMFGFVADNQPFRIDVQTSEALKKHFSYKSGNGPYVSTHRGGAYPGLPEESTATFEKTLTIAPSTMEIDPRFTKDSVMVMLHDPTLDRVTTGTGKVSDYTWEEIKKLHLKDKNGKVTPYKVQTFDEVLVWARGKTILMLDKKDIPWNILEKKIREHKAEGYAMVMVHTVEEAKQYYNKNKKMMLEVQVFDLQRVLDIDKSGVPWSNILAYVGFKDPKNKVLFDMIHQRGAMCLYKAGRGLDKEFSGGPVNAYQDLMASGIDVVETNLTADVYAEIKKYNLKN